MGTLLGRIGLAALGRFYAKFSADLALNGAVQIAWQALFSLFPLLLGLLGLVGLAIRDPERRLALVEAIQTQFPAQVTDLLGFMEETRDLGGLLGLASVLGLIWSGYWLFVTMELVFNHFYEVPDRGFGGQVAMSLTMMAMYAVLITVSVSASGLSTFLVGISDRILPFDIPGLALILGWLVSLGSALLMFLAVYRVVPNRPLSLAEVWPGGALAAVLFMLLAQAFPLYLRFFGGTYTSYKTLGLFLLLMTWFYCLALILVVGAELNAFLAGRGAAPGDGAPSSATGPRPADRPCRFSPPRRPPG
jgi:membrane protein